MKLSTFGYTKVFLGKKEKMKIGTDHRFYFFIDLKCIFFGEKAKSEVIKNS
jgi:hypothetical protein